MLLLTDQTGSTISLQSIPRRIVSLVPSQTELLYHLGLEEEVVGITKFCVHPEKWFRSKTRVGGTKQVSMDIIHRLQPDLIIANKEENVKEQVEALSNYYPVWVSDVNNLDDACDMISAVSGMVQKQEQGKDMISRIRQAFNELQQHVPPVRTAYLIWREPYMTVGGDTFIHDMMMRCGLENVFGSQARYPSITISQLQAAPQESFRTNCQLLLLSSEPYPFKQKHVDELQQQLPGVKIMLVDGEMFSWYGSRLLLATAYFKELLQKLKVKSEK